MQSPYDPTADYAIEALPQLISKHNYPIGDGYEDYYNYVQWSLGDPVYYPTAFGFTGPGPSTEIDFSSIVLGSVYSYFTEGATAGPPDHVRVISDTGQSEQQCGTIRRRIVFQVVDINGRRAGSRNDPVSGSCGYDELVSKWIWYPRGKPEKVLTSNTYHVRNGFVHVNGGTELTDGTQLYP